MSVVAKPAPASMGAESAAFRPTCGRCHGPSCRRLGARAFVVVQGEDLRDSRQLVLDRLEAPPRQRFAAPRFSDAVGDQAPRRCHPREPHVRQLRRAVLPGAGWIEREPRAQGPQGLRGGRDRDDRHRLLLRCRRLRRGVHRQRRGCGHEHRVDRALAPATSGGRRRPWRIMIDIAC